MKEKREVRNEKRHVRAATFFFCLISYRLFLAHRQRLAHGLGQWIIGVDEAFDVSDAAVAVSEAEDFFFRCLLYTSDAADE